MTSQRQRLSGFICLLGILFVFPNAVNAQDHDKIVELVSQLDAETYELRDAASKQLAEMGSEVLSVLEASFSTASPEAGIRALNIVRSLAANGDDATYQLAMALLNRLKDGRENPAMARRAKRVVDELAQLVKQKLAAKLTTLGIDLEFETIRKSGRLVDVVTSAKVGNDWTGTNEDLMGLIEFDDLRALTFNHPSINDQSLAQLYLKRLDRLTIRKADITSIGVKSIRRHGTLSSLAILYCPIDEECVETLKSFRNIGSLQLIGTKVPEELEAELNEAIGGIVEIRRGAFFGIKYNRGAATCLLTNIVANSAAEKSGLKVGDTIVEFDGNKIGTPEDLTTQLKRMEVGSRATIKYVRKGNELETTVEFGEWDDPLR